MPAQNFNQNIKQNQTNRLFEIINVGNWKNINISLKNYSFLDYELLKFVLEDSEKQTLFMISIILIK